MDTTAEVTRPSCPGLGQAGVEGLLDEQVRAGREGLLARRDVQTTGSTHGNQVDAARRQRLGQRQVDRRVRVEPGGEVPRRLDPRVDERGDP
jgi:hypothetical protein